MFGLAFLPALALPAWLSAIVRFLTVTISFQVWMGLALAFALLFWHNGRVNDAVDRAKQELVQDAEKEADKKTLETLKAEREFLVRKAETLAERERILKQANDALTKQVADATAETDDLEDEIQELLSKPVGPSCTVSKSLIERLR